MTIHTRFTTTLLSIFFAGFAASALAQFKAPAAAAPGNFEEPPLLDATILKPEFARGAHFQVRGIIPTYAGRNQYTIDSDYGTFDADGNSELVARVQEILAIEKLREVSRTDEFKSALEKAAKSPVEFAKHLAKDPVKTVSGVPKGIWKFMNRAGQSVKEVGQERQRSPYEDGAGKDMIGFSKAKRDLALDLGVDPYSSNETLQKELNSIAWASFGGGMAVKLALAPVGGAAGAAITGVSVGNSATDALRDKSPSDIRRIGLGKLLEVSVPREDANALLNSPAYSPTNQALLVDALASLKGVTGVDEFVRLATEATDEADAVFFRRSAQVMSKVHRDSPLVVVSTAQAFPVCLANDGTLVVPLEWDYVSWTPRAAEFMKTLKSGNFGDRKTTGYHVVITGTASNQAKDQLTANGFRLTEKALPGPLQ